MMVIGFIRMVVVVVVVEKARFLKGC